MSNDTTLDKVTYAVSLAMIICLIGYLNGLVTFSQSRALVERSQTGSYCVKPYTHTQFMLIVHDDFNKYRVAVDCYSDKNEAIESAQRQDDRYRDSFVVYK